MFPRLSPKQARSTGSSHTNDDFEATPSAPIIMTSLPLPDAMAMTTMTTMIMTLNQGQRLAFVSPAATTAATKLPPMISDYGLS